MFFIDCLPQAINGIKECFIAKNALVPEKCKGKGDDCQVKTYLNIIAGIRCLLYKQDRTPNDKYDYKKGIYKEG